MIFKTIEQHEAPPAIPLDALFKTRIKIGYHKGNILLVKEYHHHDNYMGQPTDKFLTYYNAHLIPYIVIITYREDDLFDLENMIVDKFLFELKQQDNELVDKDLIISIIHFLENLVRSRKLNKLLAEKTQVEMNG